MSDARRLLRPAVWLFYVAIGLEFLFMISPFALYFYSSYGPALNVLHHWPATAWLTGFYLPHFSFTDSPVLDGLKPVGFVLGLSGLALFLVGAVQIYGAKLLRRGAVTGGLYRFVRHPQYGALVLLGSGLAVVWPRFLVLLAFVTMLFLYVVLARWEERSCLEKYGESYRDYMTRTGMLLPRLSFARGSATARGRRAPIRPAVAAGLYVAAILAAILVGIALRDLSLSRVSSHYEQDTAVLSPAVLASDELEGAYRLARGDLAVTQRLRAAGPEARWIVYVVPESWHLADLPLESWFELEPEQQKGHVTPADFDRSMYKVLFTRARSHRAAASGKTIVTSAYGRDPFVRVHVDLGSNTVTAVESPPPTVVWGDIPTPLF